MPKNAVLKSALKKSQRIRCTAKMRILACWIPCASGAHFECASDAHFECKSMRIWLAFWLQGHCFNFLVKRGDSICKFTKFKEKYSLFIPNKDILSLCKTCETEIRIAKIQESFFKPNLMDTVVQKSINNFCLKHPAFFQPLDVKNHDVSHRYLLLKKIAVNYFKLRMHRESKVHNIDKKMPKIRHKLHKLVHQKHQ